MSAVCFSEPSLTPPGWLARRGQLKQARKVIAFTNAGIAGMDIDEELNVLVQTIEQQKARAAEAQGAKRFDVLRGLNLKRFLIGAWPKVDSSFFATRSLN